jgi:hypothetical protein
MSSEQTGRENAKLLAENERLHERVAMLEHRLWERIVREEWTGDPADPRVQERIDRGPECAF